MTYGEIQGLRKVGSADRRGTTFVHALNQDHRFTTQYPLAWDKPEMHSGGYDRRYELKRTGRLAAGHLFHVGEEESVVHWEGFYLLKKGCDGYGVGDAMIELELLKQFLRGDEETMPYRAEYPYPVVRIGHGMAEAMPTTPGPWATEPWAPGVEPWAGGSYVALQAARAPWLMAGYYVYVADSLKHDEPRHDGVDYIPYSFDMWKVPGGNGLVMV